MSHRSAVAAEAFGDMPSGRVRLVVALPHAGLRDAIATALISHSISVVGRADDLTQAIELSREQRPDGVLVGAALLRSDIVRELRGLIAAIPAARIVVIGTETSVAYAAAMAAGGAAAYAALDGGPDAVISAVRRAIPLAPVPEP